MNKQELVEANWAAICAGGQTDLSADDAEDEPEWARYDNDVLEAGGCEHLVLTDDEADARAAEYVRDSLWAFNASFLATETNLDEAAFKAIHANDRCEDNNPAILAIIKGTCGIDAFVEAAVSADGRGHFLSGYDGEEREITVGDTTLYFYRTN